jgi:hypothetical protein
MIFAPSDPFEFRIHSQDLDDLEPALRVLRGELLCAHYPAASSAIECDRVTRALASSRHTRIREGDAAGTYLGTFHWRKPPEEYAREARQVTPAVEDALDSGLRGWPELLSELAHALKAHGVTLRPSDWGGTPAPSALIRSWDPGERFNLIPHEDEAQCVDPAQRGCEIQLVQAFAVCSANLCIANEGGGELMFWNFQPSPSDRIRLGTAPDGGPYQESDLAGYAKITREISPGDFYIFNGSFVHAVGAAGGVRATVSCLLGYRDKSTVITWT